MVTRRPATDGGSSAGSVIDSHEVSRTLEEYRAYVESSRGEFSVTKNVYAATRSGWFSCRSVCYLAAGRPVLVQETGFSEVIPTGEGILAFDDLNSASRALSEVERNYAAHSEAARKAGQAIFGYEPVLSNILERAGIGSR